MPTVSFKLKPNTVNTNMAITNQEAFMGILACVIAADGKILDAETSHLDAICHHHKFTKNLSPDEYNRLHSVIKTNIDNQGWHNCIKLYTKSIDKSWSNAVLLMALDLVLVDGVVDIEERKAINLLMVDFGIEKSIVIQYFRIMAVKNGLIDGASGGILNLE